MSFITPNFCQRVLHKSKKPNVVQPTTVYITPTRVVPPDFAQQSEAQFSAWIIKQLRPYFFVEEQVWGTHLEGKKLRVDAVITLIEDTSKQYAVEFKKPVVGKTIDACHLLTQAIDYRRTDWTGYGKLPVLICPGFEGRLRSDGTANPWPDWHMYARAMAAHCVGELFFTYRGDLSVRFAGDHPHWTSTGGLTHDGRTWSHSGLQIGS
jgi:hypothetical protein